MKKSFVTIILMGFVLTVFGQTADLNGVTFGFGAGYTGSFNRTYSYSLTTDGTNSLKLQPINKAAFVISSVIMIKLGKSAVDQTTGNIVSQSQTSQYNALKTKLTKMKIQSDDARALLLNYTTMTPSDPEGLAKTQKQSDDKASELKNLQGQLNNSKWASIWDHLSLNLAVDLVNVTPNPSFNKNVSGGLGVGYFFNDYVQLALFYDISVIPQLRDYVVDTYQNKPIPNGTGSDGKVTNYTSLSTDDSNLFYNKVTSGLTVKLIFSLANKKASSSN